MKKVDCLLTTAIAIAIGFIANAQDGDLLTSSGGGVGFLQASPLVQGGPIVAPFNLNVGTSAFSLATLNVRGDQLPVQDVFSLGFLNTFRTDVLGGAAQSWWMYRGANHIGRIYHLNNHRVFYLQSMEPGDTGQDRYSGILMLNNDNDGLWIVNNGGPLAARAFPDPAVQVLGRVGYAALGPRTGWLFTGATTPRGPWSRFHLFHDVTGTRPLFAFRPQMKNGITLTGNSDHPYMGQFYQQGLRINKANKLG